MNSTSLKLKKRQGGLFCESNIIFMRRMTTFVKPASSGLKLVYLGVLRFHWSLKSIYEHFFKNIMQDTYGHLLRSCLFSVRKN